MTDEKARAGAIWKSMIASLSRLAAKPCDQIAYVEEIGTSPCLDELALEFSDAYLPLQGLAKALDFRHEQMDLLRPLDAKLEEMSGLENSWLWTTDALDGSEWSEVRRLASDALRKLPQLDTET